jgi:hypothetical protein
MQQKSKSTKRQFRQIKSDLWNELDRNWGAQRIRESAPYDGLLGLPPSWMPDPLEQEFQYHRGALLNQYTVEEIQAWRKARADEIRAMQDGEFWVNTDYPFELAYQLDSLNYIETIANLGKHEGIEAYLGKSAVPVYRGIVLKSYEKKIEQANSMSQGKRKGSYGRLRILVIEILLEARNKKKTLSDEDVWTEIKNRMVYPRLNRPCPLEKQPTLKQAKKTIARVVRDGDLDK